MPRPEGPPPGGLLLPSGRPNARILFVAAEATRRIPSDFLLRMALVFAEGDLGRAARAPPA